MVDQAGFDPATSALQAQRSYRFSSNWLIRMADLLAQLNLFLNSYPLLCLKVLRFYCEN